MQTVGDKVVAGLRAAAGLPVLVLAYALADFGAYELAYLTREVARKIAGMK